MQRRSLAALVPLVLTAAPLAAQDAPPLGSVEALAPAGVHRAARRPPVAAPADTDTTASDRTSRTGAAASDSARRLQKVYTADERLAMRTAVGALGWVGGVLVGGRVGIALLGRDCNCDDPGLDSFLTGAAVGSVVGTALVVSALDFGDRCHWPARFTLAAVGAALGTAGSLILASQDNAGYYNVILVPLVSGFGGAAGAALCTVARPSPRHHY